MADSMDNILMDATVELVAEDGAVTGAQETRDVAGNENKFQRAVAAWRTLDLTNTVSTLDNVAAEMVAQQKESLVQRKELAQKTKDFRKLEDEAKLAEIRELLKAYQGYVDVLTNHSKTVSSAFMQVYSPLSDAPDPYPLLEASIDSLVTVDEVVPRLESENERLRKQSTKLNRQLEETEKQLEEERSKRLSLEGSQDSRIKQVETSWTAVLKEKEDNWSAKERSLEEKAENHERLLRELKASYEVSQRLEKSGEDAQDIARNTASAAELDFANSELEKVTVRLAEVEVRNEQLRFDLAQATSQSNSSARSTSVEDDPAFLRLRSENTSLLRRLDSARYDKDSERSNMENKLRGLEREVGTIKADRDAMQSKVQKWGDYEAIKRELDMLRAIEFAAVNDADAEYDSHPNGDANKVNGESLEQLLVARNKKLSNELTELRVSHQDIQQRLEQLQEDLSNTNMDLEKARNLNATLENDLQKTQQEAFNAFETMSVAGTYSSRYPSKSTYGSSRRGGGISGGGGPSPTSSIIGGFDSSTSGPPGSPLIGGGGSGSGNSGILPMVTAQRDRFKKKITELELELQKQYQTVSSLRSEISSLQKDNLNLYEKSRYVSSYSRNNGGGGGGGGAGGGGGGGGGGTSGFGAASGNSYPNQYPNNNSNGNGRGGDITSDRYRSAYESNLSPFAAFRGRESARALRKMSLPERAVWQVTRMVLATRTSRNLFAVYCLGLHLLVLCMLYWMSSVDGVRHASHLGETAAAAVGAAVGGAGQGDDGGGVEWRVEEVPS